MELHAFRHGPAASREESGAETDRQRPLTEEGTDETHRAALGVRAIVGQIDGIATSPYRRAQQTARILADAFDVAHGEIETLDELAPDGDPAKALEVVWNRFDGDVALVGHRPHLNRLVATALTGDTGGMSVHLGNASLASVRLDEDGSQLRRLVQPRQLKRFR